MATLYDSGSGGDYNNAFYGMVDEEQQKKKPTAQQEPAPQMVPAQAPAQQTQPAPPAQVKPTFAEMQKAGQARPNPPAPAPAQVMPYAGQMPVLTQQTAAQAMPYSGQMVNSQGFQPMPAPTQMPTNQQTMSGQGLDIGAELARRYQQGGVSPEVRQGISAAIANPSAYNSQLVRDIYGQLGQDIDDEFAQREVALREEMAGRGLSDSSIQGGRLADLNVGRRSARQGLANQLGQMVAQDYSGARDRALGMGMARDQFGQQLGQSYLDRLMGFGQQAFQNDLTQAEFNRQLQNDQDRLMMQMFGIGG